MPPNAEIRYYLILALVCRFVKANMRYNRILALIVIMVRGRCLAKRLRDTINNQVFAIQIKAPQRSITDPFGAANRQPVLSYLIILGKCGILPILCIPCPCRHRRRASCRIRCRSLPCKVRGCRERSRRRSGYSRTPLSPA